MGERQIEIVVHNPGGGFSGIGRYIQEIARAVGPELPVVQTTSIDPPLAGRLSFLHHLPLGVRGHRPGNVVHFPQIFGCAQMLWRPVRPAMATVHDLGVLVCPEDARLFNRFDRAILDLQFAGLKRMDRWVVSSEYTRSCLVERLSLPEERIDIVPLAVDLDNFRPIADAGELAAAKYQLERQDGVFTIIYTGSELPRKNVGLLLEALAALKQRGHRLRLLKIGGAGGQRWRAQFQADLARLGLEGEVRIFEGVPEADLPLFYNLADLAVTPTLLEGSFAWMIMEGLACGTPGVASAGALIPPGARDSVLVVEPRALEPLIEAIARCIDDPALLARMAAGARAVVEPYTWQATAGAMVRIYRALLDRPAP